MALERKATCSSGSSLRRGVGVGRAFQLAYIPVESNEILSQEGFEAAYSGVNLAVEAPPHADLDAQQGDERGECCPVHIPRIHQNGAMLKLRQHQRVHWRKR